MMAIVSTVHEGRIWTWQ